MLPFTGEHSSRIAQWGGKQGPDGEGVEVLDQSMPDEGPSRRHATPGCSMELCGGFTKIGLYILVMKHSYWKSPFIVGFPIKDGDFP